jgi:2-polyprenyl-3-methyl-5-hydroxy-6-metoxy-1,4-benzoquinol methylase
MNANLKNYYEHCAMPPGRECQRPLDAYRFNSIVDGIKRIAKTYKASVLTVVDAGAGSGAISIDMAGMGHKVISIDIAESSLLKFAEVARKLGIQQVVSPLEATPLAGEFADIVICSEVLEHLVDPQKVLDELARITKQNGYLVVSVPYAQILQEVLCPNCLQKFFINGHIHSFNKNTLLTMLSNAGYKTIKSKIIAKPITSRLLRIGKISLCMARIIDMLHPKVENKGWLIMIAQRK